MASNTVVQTNVLALNSHRNLGMVGIKKEKASQRLSSGFRINSAADDAAGLAISEKMRAQIRGLDGASKNTQDGISMIQVAEGGLSKVNDMLLRIRELVEDAANDTKEGGTKTGLVTDKTDGKDRQKIQEEINELVRGIDAIANDTEFNKKKLLRGDYNDSKIEARPNIDTYLAQTTSAQIGSGDKIGDSKVDVSKNSLAPTGVTPTTLWLQIGANAGQGIKVNINAVSAYALGLTAKLSEDTTGVYATKGGVAKAGKGIEVLINVVDGFDPAGSTKDATGTVVNAAGTPISGENISKYLTGIDDALSYVQKERAKLGAIQNRLTYTDENLQTASENLQNAESRIRDTDMAKEMMNLTKANVIQQAAISMLAQANQQPQSILQLLQ